MFKNTELMRELAEANKSARARGVLLHFPVEQGAEPMKRQRQEPIRPEYEWYGVSDADFK